MERAWDLLGSGGEDVSEEDVYSVGVDAGTSGVRVAIYQPFSREYTLFDFGKNEAGGTRFSLPALIGFDGEHLLIGNEAASLPWDRRFTSFKAGLLYEDQAEGATARWERMGLPHATAFSAWDGPQVPDFLYALSIARALGLAMDGLIPDPEKKFLTITVGAPYNDDPRVKARFSRALACAVRLANAVPERCDPELAVEAFAAAWLDSKPMAEAPETDRRIWVRHEAALLIQSLSDLLQEGRTFLIADIGATTTEMAILRLGRDRLHRWAARSHPLGVDRADLLMASADKDADLLVLRRARIEGKKVRGTAAGLKSLSTDLRQQARAVVHASVKLNPDRESWREVNVALAGGGSMIPELRRAFLAGPRPHAFVEQVVAHDLKLRGTKTGGASRVPPRIVERSEIACVLGAAGDPEEAREYSDEELDVVIPTYHDDLRELEKAKKSQWLP